jgi:hypothetical protein
LRFTTALGPAKQQDDRLAGTRRDIVEAHPVHPDHVMCNVAERRLRQGRTGRADPGQQRKRSENAHG